MRSLLKKIRQIHFISFCIFILFTTAITYPLLFHLTDFATGTGDELVIAWIQNWVIHALLTNPLQLFQANIYYPFHNTLAYSDLFLTSSIFSMPFLFFMKQPIVAQNITFFTGLLFFGFSIYLLSYFLTKSYVLSFLSGLLILFSPAVLDHAVHVQILAIAGVPLSILCFFLFIDKKQKRYLFLSLLIFVLQTYNSFLPGYFIVFFYGITVVSLFLFDRKKLHSISIKQTLFSFCIALAFLIPVVLPYYAVSHEFSYVRDIKETIHFALQPEDFFYANDSSRLKNTLLPLANIKQAIVGEVKPGYPGFVFSILSLFSLYDLLKNRKKNTVPINILLCLGLLGLVLSFGPLLHFNRRTIHHPFLIPLPYFLLYYLVPGFQGIRNSARFEMLFLLCMAVLISIVLKRTTQQMNKIPRILVYCLLFLGIICEYNFPMRFIPIPQTQSFPQIDQWLAINPGIQRTIQLPIYNWNMFPYTQQELQREYYATIHFHTMVNGYSGFSPPPWQHFISQTYQSFPSEQSLLEMKRMGISYILLHSDEYNMLSRNKFVVDKKPVEDAHVILDKIKKIHGYHFFKRIGEVYIFQI